MPKTDGARVVADLKRLAEFGRYKTGVHRPTYSPEDVASRHWLAEKFAEAGLDPVIDGIGNVIGRNPHASRRLLVGSHSETQPHGGWLDGALGVIYGLELARACAAEPALAGLGIEPVAWAGGAMVRLATRLHDRFAALAGRRTVWTIGRILLDPNAPSIVPGRAEMQVQFRDTDTAYLALFEQTLLEIVAEADRMGPCGFAI